MERRKIHLPVIDLSPFWNAEQFSFTERETTAAMLAIACEKHGMFYVTCPTSANILSGTAFRAAHSLFSLPLAVKQAAVPVDPVPSAARGYLGVGAESGGSLHERKEAFSFSFDCHEDRSREDKQRNALQAPNVWPFENPTGGSQAIRPVFESLFVDMSQIALAIARAFAVALGDRELVDICLGGTSVSLMRCMHYLPESDDATGSIAPETGSSQHTDWSLCTIIAVQESIESRPALQVLSAGEWWDVPPMKDALVVNCGDYMALRSKGRFRSPWHRVNLTPFERTSFVYFQYPKYDTPVPPFEPLDKSRTLSLLQNQSAHPDEANVLASEQGTATISYGDFIAMKWKQVARCSATGNKSSSSAL
jgi:isopenicillin N synthase-like dioxygenase